MPSNLSERTTKPVTVRVPLSLLPALQQAALADGVRPSTWVANLVRKSLGVYTAPQVESIGVHTSGRELPVVQCQKAVIAL